MDPSCLIPGDATLIENIVNYLKAKGIFDEFRHECLADVDTKSSCQNLDQRVDGYTSKFLANETWHPDLNKNELRNKLRRHIDGAGFLAPGADCVVEQTINPKVYHYFLPKIIEVVHQYVKEQSEMLNKKPETVTSSRSSTSEKPIGEFEDKDKTQKSDPIADILSFSFHAKTENVQHKHGDASKVEKKKEERIIPAVEKGTPELQDETMSFTSSNETKLLLEKEKDKVKKEDHEIQQEVLKKVVKDEMKSERKKADDVKAAEVAIASEENKSTVPVSLKLNISSKKDDKSKHKSKSQNVQKSSSSSSEIKKLKKESSEKSSEKSSDKLHKTKPTKSSKESSTPTKSSSSKSAFKDEKSESSKTKSHDATSSKTSESPMKKSKSSSDKKDRCSSKHKSHSEKSDKSKISKSTDKNESHVHNESSNSEKSSKTIQYSSSYDSSQGSDQEKSTSTTSKKERSKHFIKHASKDKTEHHDSSNKSDKKRHTKDNESPSKRYKSEKDAKLKLKDTSAVEAAKISSRSNSFGSTSSVSSSSNASKDNLASNSDEVSENPAKDKKKKQPKEKDSCHNSSKTLPPPPPPPPPPLPSTSLTTELTSSAEMSSVEDTQSSLSEAETSGSEEISEESSSDSELESKDLINVTLNENALNSSTDNINAFYDIFLYSSSSSEFEGYGDSPEKKNTFDFANICESDVSISSVHTSDLSSFDDELSSDDEVAQLTGGLKKRLSLKEAQEIIENKAVLNAKKKVEFKTQIDEDSLYKESFQKPSSLTCEDESPPSEPVRSLRRERKLNPRYSSSEYTSIFNCKKETFITKQSSPARSQTSNSSPKAQSKLKKTDSLVENNKLVKQSFIEDKNIQMDSDYVEGSVKSKSKLKKELQDKNDGLNDSKMSSSDELDSIMDKEKLFKENNKNNLITDDDKIKDHKQLKPYNNSKVRNNSHSLKRKLEITESPPAKRPCSRSSVDSSSSEFAPNENKPFNSEKKDFNDEKILNDCSLKVSNLNIGVKKDVFCKQRTNNNGDVLGQKDIFPKNSHSKVVNTSEKKTNETDTSKELNTL